MKFEDLKGNIILNIKNTGDELVLICLKGDFIMQHHQDCCESVHIEDINGDLNDLIGFPILQADESTNSEDSFGRSLDSFTWTFYKLATIKGYVTIRWLGESNGYYSESVDFEEIDILEDLYYSNTNLFTEKEEVYILDLLKSGTKDNHIMAEVLIKKRVYGKENSNN